MDAVLTVKTNPERIKVGDIIAYSKIIPFAPRQIIIHRVVSINEEPLIFKTKGDANPSPDPWDISPREIVGKVIFTIPKLGWFFHYLRLYLLPIILISVGLGLIFLYLSQKRNSPS